MLHRLFPVYLEWRDLTRYSYFYASYQCHGSTVQYDPLVRLAVLSIETTPTYKWKWNHTENDLMSGPVDLTGVAHGIINSQ